MNSGDIGQVLSIRQEQTLNRFLRSHIRVYRQRQAVWNIAGRSTRNPVAALTTSPVPPAVIMPTFVEDPFEGDINPGDSNGQKLYTMATAERSMDAKITISQAEVVNVMNLFRRDSNSFGWGILTGCIETPAGAKLSILENYHSMTLDLVKKVATKTFSDIHFDLLNDVPDPMVTSTIKPAKGDKDHVSMFFRRS